MTVNDSSSDNQAPTVSTNSDVTDDSSAARIIEQFRRADRGKNVCIVDTLASGSMANVYQVFDVNILRYSAMKVLSNDLRDSAQAAQHFIEEARINGQLEHPNIIPLYSLGLSSDDQLFFTMKLISGDSLLAIIKRLIEGHSDYIRRYNQFTLLTIFRKVCDAVSYAHSKNVVHRDIKPSNIMIGPYGEVLLVDWGIAKFLGSDEVSISSQRELEDFASTVHGAVKGTPQYMSPEQARGDNTEYDVTSDIFLLGATLYHMMTYSPPYVEKTIKNFIKKARECDFPPPVERAPARMLPDELNSIIMKAMSPNKKDRYQSVEELAQSIDSLISGHAASTFEEYTVGDIIINVGETGRKAYVISTGAVEVYKEADGKKTVYTTLRAGDVFGEMACITDEVRSASARAIENTCCLVITGDSVNSQLRKTPSWFEKIVNALVKRLRESDDTAHPLLLSDCTYEVINQMKLLFLCYGRIDPLNILEFELDDLIFEISNNLKIPASRVRIVVDGLVEIDLVDLSGNGALRISNWNLFTDFVDFCRRLSTSDGTATLSQAAICNNNLYSDGTNFIHCHSKHVDNDQTPNLTTSFTPIADSLTAEAGESYRRAFHSKLEFLQEFLKR